MLEAPEVLEVAREFADAEGLQNTEISHRFGPMAFNDLRFVGPVISEPWANERRDPDLPHTKKNERDKA